MVRITLAIAMCALLTLTTSAVAHPGGTVHASHSHAVAHGHPGYGHPAYAGFNYSGYRWLGGYGYYGPTQPLVVDPVVPYAPRTVIVETTPTVVVPATRTIVVRRY